MAPQRDNTRGRKTKKAASKRGAPLDESWVQRLASAPEPGQYVHELTDPDKVLASVLGCRIEPAEAAARLRSPKLRIRADDPGSIYAYTIAVNDEPAVQVGLGLHPFLRHYARAAFVDLATAMGEDTKRSWPASRRALATTFEWLTLGGDDLHLPYYAVPQKIRLLAENAAALAYRFLICHELAHVALGHLTTGEASIPTMGEKDLRRLRASQADEIDADRLGLHLHVTSFLNSFANDERLRINALIGAMWGLCAMNLLQGRLMVLGAFVDERRWQISLSHPPDLQRFFFFLGTATEIAGDDIEGMLDKLRTTLFEFNLTVWNESDRWRTPVESALTKLSGQDLGRGARSDAVRTRFHELLELSPVGVLRTLADPTKSEQFGGLASMLPADLLSLLQQSTSERGDALA